MRIYWDCKNCGCQTPGVAVYRCSNPNCRDMYCGRCHSGEGLCGCSWEEEDDDDGNTTTRYGELSYFGKICSRAEWDAKIADEEAERRLGEAREAKEKALDEKYRKKLIQLPTLYELIGFDLTKERLTERCLVDIDARRSKLLLNGRRLDLSSVQKIDRSYPCGCNPGCRETRGGGYIMTKGGESVSIKNWAQKEGVWPFRKLVTYHGLWGMLAVRVALADGHIDSTVLELGIKGFRSLSIYVPSRRELVGE